MSVPRITFLCLELLFWKKKFLIHPRNINIYFSVSCQKLPVFIWLMTRNQCRADSRAGRAREDCYHRFRGIGRGGSGGPPRPPRYFYDNYIMFETLSNYLGLQPGIIDSSFYLSSGLAVPGQRPTSEDTSPEVLLVCQACSPKVPCMGPLHCLS